MRDRRLEAKAIGELAAIHHAAGRLEEARAAYCDGIAIHRAAGDRREEALYLACLAAIEAQLGNINASQEAFREAEVCLGDAAEPAYRAAIEVWRGFLDLARAARAARAGLREEEALQRRTVLARIREATMDASLAQRSAAVSGALRMLEAAVAQPACEAPVPEPDPDPEPEAEPPALPALAVSLQGDWFSWRGTTVWLHRRQALRGMLSQLVAQRVRAPGTALPIPALFRSGWQGQRARADAAANRVHNALSTLRAMGLREALLRREDGYLLDPSVPIEPAEDPVEPDAGPTTLPSAAAGRGERGGGDRERAARDAHEGGGLDPRVRFALKRGVTGRRGDGEEREARELAQKTAEEALRVYSRLE